MRRKNQLHLRKISPSKATLAAFGLTIAAGMPAQAQTVTITNWTFEGPTADTVTSSPAPVTGTGTSASLGMTNTYPSAIAGATAGSNDNSDVFPSVASADGTSSTGSTDIWRIRGGGTIPGTTTKSGNGWNSAAPQYTQGAQFTTSTGGYTNVNFTFDWAATKQGVNTLQVQYTLNGSSYQNYTGNITSGGSVVGTNGELVFAPITSGQPWLNANLVDFSGIAGANNDPTFGVQLVSAYAPNSGGPGVASAYQNTSGTALNNSSGNWRFDNVSFSGISTTAAPEPSGPTALLIGTSVLGLMAARRRRKGSAAS